MRGIDQDGRAVLSRTVALWNAAAASMTASALAELYTDDAVFMGGLPEQSVGRGEIEAYFNKYVDVMSAMRLTLRDAHLLRPAVGLVLAQGMADFTFDLVDGRQTAAILRATLAIVHEGDDWRICLHHISPSPAVSPVPR